MKTLNCLLIKITLIALLANPGVTLAEIALPLSVKNIPPAFTASYAVKFGGMSVGSLEVKLSRDDDNHWTYHSSSSANGLAALFVGSNDVTDTAKLALYDGTIRPTSYERIRITSEADKSERVFYQWDEKQAQSQYKDREQAIDLDDTTTDKFTLQLLIMSNIHHIPNKMTLPVISKAELKQYEIVNSGRETLNTVYGQRDTIIVERIKDDSSYKIWADAEHHGLPVKIERIKQGKTEYVVILEESSLFQASEKVTTQTMNSPQSSYFQPR